MTVDRRRLLWMGAGVLGGLLVVYLLLLLLSGGGAVPKGTRVLGVDIGGLEEQAAVDRLDTALADRVKAPVPVRAAGKAFTLDPVTAGLGFDARATVRAAGGRTLDPVTLLGRLFGSRDVAPVVVADDARLTEAIDALGATVDQAAVDGAVTFVGGVPRAVEPQAGHGILRSPAAAAVTAAYLVSSRPVELPVGDIPPSVDAAEVQQALATFAQQAVSGPVTLNVARKAIPVPVTTFSRYLSMVAQDGNLVPRLDAAGLKKALAGPLAGVEKPAVNATFRLTGGSPAIVASQPGTQIPPDQLAASFVAVLPRTSDRVVAVPLVTVQPAVTTEEANTLGVTEKVSTFTTHYPYAAYRLQNIHRAADLIDGTVLMPGQVFSLNRIVGERTADNGFAIGTIIDDGKFAKDYGGGTSQVATTTFNAAFFAGLKIITHKTHSFYISRYPAGREATVAWPDVDLQFQNDSGHAIVVDTSYTSSTVTVTLWGTKVWDIDSVSGPRYNQRAYTTQYDPTSACVPQDGVMGFDIDVTRVFRHGTTVVKREPFHTHYNPAAQIYCRAAPGPSPSPSPSGSPTPSPTPSPTH
jgi:vancomycin resistance protein YoaR